MRCMWKSIAQQIGLVLALTLTCWLGQEAAYAGSPPVRVVYGFDREFPPFSFEEAGGHPAGFEIDLLRAVFTGQNVELFMRPLSWESVQLDLSSGEINISSGMIKTAQRSKLYLFSEEPSFPIPIRLFTKVYNRYPSAAMLRGMPVSVDQGSYQHRLLERFGGINIKPYKNKVDGLRALYNDDVAAYCGLMQSTYYYINKLHYGAITTVGTPLGITEIHFAVNRGRGDILRLLNQGMKRTIESGEYDRLYRKWFVRELTDQEEKQLLQTAQAAAIPAYVPYGGTAQGAAVLTATGKLYGACTMENAQGSLAISALRGAVLKAITDGEFELRAAVVVGQDGVMQELTPEELQTLYEFGRGILVLGTSAKKDERVQMVAQKLPKPVVRLMNSINID